MADDGSDDAKKAARLAASIGGLFGASGSLLWFCVYPQWGILMHHPHRLWPIPLHR
ncbi:MAG: hypothetical protein M3R38_22385 [Actinomycetota bacterium]|nr:hypothetical protein [Actinomycetota bacterium]